MAHTGSTGLSSWAYGGSRYTVSHGRAAISPAIAALTVTNPKIPVPPGQAAGLRVTV
jgi:hypothetical protein